MPVSENTIRSLLRRLRSVAPAARTVSWHGEARDVFCDVAESEGFSEKASSADARVYFLPDGSFVPSTLDDAQVIVVVARSVADGVLLHLHSRRTARHSLPLSEWVREWAGPSLARILVSPAVGDRPILTRWPGRGEWIYRRDASAVQGQSVGEWIKFLLVTYFGTGMVSIMPATVGCVFMLPPAFAIYALWGMSAFGVISLGVAILATIGSVVLERWAMRRFLSDDPREFVLDEVAGLALAWSFLPADAPWWSILVAFAAFRVFDIFKWGVSWVEKLPIRGKVVWDDLLAGLYAGVLTWLIVR